MQTFIPFGLVLNVIKSPGASLHRCQLCKETTKEGEILIVNNGDERLLWMFSVSHLECFKKLVEQRFERLCNLDVSLTPKLTSNGPKVEVNVGSQSFHFTPDNAMNLGAALVLSSISITFDDWVYDLMTKEGIPQVVVLNGLRSRRAERTIGHVSMLGNHELLLRDCWDVFVDTMQKDLGPFESSVIERWHLLFKKEFGIGEGRVQ